MVRSVLVTGATGMLGAELVRQLGSADVEVTILLRRSARAPDLAGLRASARINVVRGDITVPDIGLDASESAGLSSRVDGILHAAALTSFNAPLDDARRVNVRGTINVLGFARRCPRLERFALVSTAYVSGRRTGVIHESDSTHDAGFVNSYERSKYEAEAAVRTSGLPATIYRLSTLVGNAHDGATHRLTAPHQALRLIYLGLAPMVAGQPGCVVDLLPTDVAARIVAALFLDGPRRGTFHIVSGAHRSFTLAEIIEASWDGLARAAPDWRRRSRPRPLVCRAEVFADAIRAARDTNNVLLLGALETIAGFCGQFEHPKTFDDTELRRVLPGNARRVPNVREYYPRVIDYCVRTDWGRRAI